MTYERHPVSCKSVYRSISGQSLSDTEMASATAHFAVENSFGQPHWLIAMLFTMRYSLFTAWCSARMKSSSNYDQFSSDTTSGRPSVPLVLSTGEQNYTHTYDTGYRVCLHMVGLPLGVVFCLQIVK